MGTPIGTHAVVLGAGIGGLLSARVLADHYARVTVIDRDVLQGTAARAGVAQGRHAHGLLAGGREVLADLFPDLLAQLHDDGVPSGDMLSQGRYHFGPQPLARSTSGLYAVGASRPFLEAAVRERVRGLPNVTLVERCDVLDLRTDADRSRVTGVSVADRGGQREPRVVDADLVLDASGRSSRTPDRLAAMGYPRPAEDVVTIDLGYTSRIYRLDPHLLRGDIVIVFAATPRHRRGAVVQLLEGGLGLVSLIGVLGDYPPADDAGFLAFGESVPVPDLHAVLRGAEPVGPAVGFRYPASVRRHYERLDRFPAGLLLLGDALCSFNPAYAQGMSVAALQSRVLQRELAAAAAAGRQPDARRYFRAAAKVVDTPWQIAVGGDLAFPEVVGRRTLGGRVINRYVAQVQAAATRDPVLAQAFLRVAALLDAPPGLMRPDRLLRVVAASRRPRAAAG